MFTIGDFSRLCCISARMLRHYDRIGLLKPYHIDKINGYRYYQSSQLEQFRQIEALKEYGFSLVEIRELLLLPEYQLRPKLTVQLEHLRETLAYTQKAVARLEADLSIPKEASHMNQNYDIIVMNQPEQRVFGIRRSICICAADIRNLLRDLYSETQKRGLTQCGPVQMTYFGSEFNQEQMEAEAQIQVSEAHADTHIIPPSLCISTIHRGSPEHIHHAYNAICKWAEEHPCYHLTGLSLERYIRDKTMVSSPDDMETAVLFPVRK